MFVIGLIFLTVVPFAHAYLLSPAPGSQEMNHMALARFLDTFLPYFLILGLLLVLGQIVKVLRRPELRIRMGMVIFCVFLLGFNFLMNVKMRASVMFGEVHTKVLADAAANKVPQGWLVMGVEHGGQATAYPVNIMAYHHRLRDTVGGMPVLVTYCSMCRTGLVFNPIVDGTSLNFRLVGAQHYNAMLEDDASGSWWYQATGEAVLGPMTGKRMQEVPAPHMTLRAWLALHPNSRVLQPDPDFATPYKSLDGYDTTGYEVDDAGKASRWSHGSWVAGVDVGNASRAYDWSALVKRVVINDVVGSVPVVVAVDRPAWGVYAWNRKVDGADMEFRQDSTGRGLRDATTGSLWNWRGECVEGTNAGKKLEPVTVRHWFWGAWRTFHPATTQWKES